MRALGKSRGFTLVELLVAMVIGSVVTTAIYSVYRVQQTSQLNQEQLVELEQNLRFAMYAISREFRMAGYPSDLGAGILRATPNEITFSADLDGDRTAERIGYGLYDADSDGDTDLGRIADPDQDQVLETYLLTENIDAIDFVYLDANGNQTTTDIRSIEVTIVGRVNRPDHRYLNTQSYLNQQEDVILPAQNDHFRRVRLSTVIHCRNLPFDG